MAKKKTQIQICRTNIGKIVILRDLIKTEKLYELAGVISGTFAAELIDRFWSYLIGHSIILQHEYGKYYKKEYSSISEFLYHKYALAPEFIQVLKPFIDQGNLLCLVQKTLGRDYQIESMFDYRDSLRQVFMDALQISFVKTNIDKDGEMSNED